MAHSLRISSQAHDDIEAIYNYVLKDGESIAKVQVSKIYSALSNLELFPVLGKELQKFISTPNDYRFIVIDKLYLAFYRIGANTVDVIRVLRGEQNYLKLLGLDK